MPLAEPMSEDDFRGHMKSEARTNFITNVVINGALAWWILSGPELLTPFGAAAYGPDLLITGFLLSAIICAIVIAIHRRKVARGELGVPLVTEPGWLAAVAKWNRWKTCGVAGLAGTSISAALLAVVALTVGSLSVPTYVVLKSVFAGALAAVVVGPAIWIGLRLGADTAQAG